MLKNIKQVSHTKTFYYKDALKVLLYLREKLSEHMPVFCQS